MPLSQLPGQAEANYPLLTLASPGTYTSDQKFTLNVPYPANNGEFKGGELIIFVGDVVNGLPISPNSNSVGAPTAAANPSTKVPPDNYAQIELTYIPSGNGAGLDIDSSSVDNVGFPFTMTYPTTGTGSAGFPINPLGITLSQQNLYNTFNSLVDSGIIPQEFQQSSTFNQQQDPDNIQIIAPGDILSHNATTPIIQSVNQVAIPGNLDANYNYFYVITAYSDNLIESYNLDTTTGIVTTGYSGVRGETLLSNSFPSSILASGKSNQINFSPYLDPNTAGYNIYRFSTPDATFTPNGDTVYNLIAQIPKAQAAVVSSTFKVSEFNANHTLLSVTSVSSLQKGMLISGQGIAPNTFITNINGSSITISIPTSGNGGGNSNSYTASTYQFLDTGSIPQAKQISGNSASSYGFNPLSEYYTEELLQFYSHYLTPNSFALMRNNVQWVGNTVFYSPGGSYIPATSNTPVNWNPNNETYLVLQLTAANGDGNTINQGQTLNIYAPFFETNTRYVSINNQSLPQMPSWLALTDVNGQQGIGNLYESPSQMVFGCDSVFASNGKDPDGGGTTSALGTYIGSIEDSIAAAFNRGIATNFAIQPDNWASFPAMSGNPVVSTSHSSVVQNETTFYYAVTATNVLGESTPSLVVGATLLPGQVATLNWTQNQNAAPPTLNYKIYRGTSPDISQMQLLNTVSGTTLTFTDTGAASQNPNTHPPFQYYAADSTSNWYSYFTQTNSSVAPVNGVSINGLSYGFAYADQGGLSTNAFFTTKTTTNNFPPAIGVHLGTINGPEFITQLLADATQGQSYSQQLQISGNVSNLSYAVTSGVLPTGLTLNSNGLISGTATSTGTSNPFTVQVTGKENGTSFAPITRTYTLTVNSSQPASQALSITGLTVPTSGPSYLTLEPVSLGIATGPGHQQYTRTISVTGGTGPYTLTPTTSVGIPLFTQFLLNQQQTLASDQNGIFTLTTNNPLNNVSVGNQTITFELKDSAPTPNTLQFQLETNVLPGLTINASAPTAYVGVPYYQKFTTNQNPVPLTDPTYPWGELTYSISSGSLPLGLSLTPWGILQGTPTQSGLFTFTVQATNPVTGITENETTSVTMNVQSSGYTPLSISNPGTLLPVLGKNYASINPLATITTSGGTSGVQLELINGQLPSGLTFNGSKIIGSVTSAEGGNYTVTFRAMDSMGHIAYQNVTISVLSITQPTSHPIPYDIYQATTQLVIPGTGFDATTIANNVLTVNGLTTVIQGGTTLNQLVANVNLTSLNPGTSMSLNLAVNGGTALPYNGYANIRQNPTITSSSTNLAQNASSLVINGANFGTGTTPSPLYGPRYFINATNVPNEAQLILEDSHSINIPFTSISGDYSTTMNIEGLDLSQANAGPLNAKLMVNGQVLPNTTTQVANIVASNAPPTINFNQNNTSYLGTGPYTVLITGSGFQPLNGSSVSVNLKNDSFNDVTVQTVTVNNDNSLLVTFTAPSRPTNLFARVVVNGVGSVPNTTDQTQNHYPNGYVQVASLNSNVGEINSNPAIAINGTQFIIYGYGFVPSSLNPSAPTSVSSLQYYNSNNTLTNISSNNYTSVCLTPNIILVTLNSSISTLAPGGTQIYAMLQNPSQGVSPGFPLFGALLSTTQASPTITPYTGASPNPISNNGYTLTIDGTNFGTAVSSTGVIGNTFVQLYLGNSTTTPLFSFVNSFFSTQGGAQNNASGVQDVAINQAGTTMTVNLAGPLPVGDIYAIVTTQGVSSTLTKVATIASSTSTPTIAQSSHQISSNPTRLIITGTNFDPTGSNVLTLSQGTVLSVTADSSTQLTAVVDGITTPGALNASLVVNGTSSGSPVQVAQVVANGPDINFSIGSLAPTASKLVIAGSNFSTTSASNTVTLFSQGGSISGAVSGVVANSANQLTVTLSPGHLQNIAAGQLYATVAVNNAGTTTSDTVQVAYVNTTTLPAPTITTNTANLSQSASTLVIQGTNFDPTGTNVLTLSNSSSVSVPFASMVVNSSTQITVTFSSPITMSGALFAEVVTDGQSSNRTQVATVVASTAPTITSSTAAIPANTTTLIIQGTGFSTTASGNQVELSSGNVTNVAVNGTGTQLTVTLNPNAGLLDPGTLTAKVTVHGEVAGPTQVATVNAVPVITPGSGLLPANTSPLYIYGSGFSTNPASNSVTFSSGTGIVSASTSTKLTVTMNPAPTAGNLTATVVSSGVSSQPAVIYSVQPVITANTSVINQQSNTITINGFGFDTDKTKNSVVLSSGTGTVTQATPTQLTVQFNTQPSLGNLLATVTTNGVQSANTQIGTVAANRITLATNAAGAVDGQAFATQPVITFLDASGQRMTGDNSSVVTMAVSTGANTIGTITATAVSGQATFTNAGIDGTPGNHYTLTFTSSSFQATSQPITLSGNTATQLGISRQANGADNGLAFTTQPIITILNSQGQLVTTDSTSMVTMSVSDGATTVGTTTVKAVNGVVNFTNAGIAGKVGVPYILTFSSGSLKAVTQSITILPGAPTQVSLSTPANGAVDNTAFTTQPVLRILDHFGQLVTGDNSTQVTMSVNNGGTLIGTITQTAVSGIVTFTNVGIDGTPGVNYTLTYSATGLTPANQIVQLTPNDNPTKLGIFRAAAGSTSGQPFTTQPVVTIQNSLGATVPSNAQVTMTVSNGATIVGTSTVTAVQGIATFSNVGLSGPTGVTYTLTFSSTGLTPVTQPIVISPLVPAKLGFTTQASGASDGRPFVVQPVMLVQDASGQTVTTDNTTQITMNVSSGATTIGTVTRTAVNGVVTFTNVGIDGLPNTNYTLTYTTSGLTSATQPIYLNPGLATHLNLSTPANGAASGSAFTTQPVLQILDAFNQVVTSDSTSLVTMQVSSGATIIGSANATARNGIVSFTNTGLQGLPGNYTLSFVSTPLLPAHQNINLSSFNPLATGSNPSSNGTPAASTVNLYDPQNGQPAGSVVPFPGFTGEIRVATGDFNSDGRFEIVAAAGQGGGPAITILDSTTGATKASFFAYDPAFTGGVFVAVKDVNNDGIADIITGAGSGGGPHVKVFNGINLQVIQSFFAYNANFTGGVTVGAADINGDQVFDIVTGAGPGGGPHVKVFNGATGSLISQWFAYQANFTGGVFVAMGDISNDGSYEVITGAGEGGGPVVAVWNPYTGALISQFMAYASVFTGGVRVGISDATGDGIADLVTGAGPGGGPQVNVYNFPDLNLLLSFYSGLSENRDGVFVS